jgi:hypothetical protein
VLSRQAQEPAVGDARQVAVADLVRKPLDGEPELRLIACGLAIAGPTDVAA